MIVSQILGLYTGKPRAFRGDEMSSIGRTETHGPIFLSKMGLLGDKFADSKHHGGADKALHIYPFEHYRRWQQMLGDHDLLKSAGAFGENISATGMTEDIIYIGDRFEIGDAIIECSHGRQPCWKIEHYFGRKNMVADILQHGHCGLYFRVIKEGMIAKDDRIVQIQAAGVSDANAPRRWSVAKLFHLLYSDQHQKHQDDLRDLMALDALAEAWKKRVQSLIK